MKLTPKTRLLIVTWGLWSFAIAVAPLLAMGFHAYLKPVETDDFGMGPFLSGAILGAILSVFFGIAALWTHAVLRKRHPLSNPWPLRLFERVVLAAPPTLILALAIVTMGGNLVTGAVFYLMATGFVLLLLR